MFRIVRREELNPATFLWEIDAPDVAASARAGQFVMVRLHDGSERIPLTIADFDVAAGTVTVVVQALGRSTVEMRDHYDEGDSIADFVGPLGMPTEIAPVGGGDWPVTSSWSAADSASRRSSRSCAPSPKPATARR